MHRYMCVFMCVCVCGERERERLIYHNELACTIMETDKSHYLLSAMQRPRNASGRYFHSESETWEPGEPLVYILVQEQEKTVVLAPASGREKEFLSFPVLFMCLTGWRMLTNSGGAICFTDSNVNILMDILRNHI